MKKRRKKWQKETFTASEVYALLERWDSKLDFILEKIASMRKTLDECTEKLRASREESNRKFESNFQDLMKGKSNGA